VCAIVTFVYGGGLIGFSVPGSRFSDPDPDSKVISGWKCLPLM